VGLVDPLEHEHGRFGSHEQHVGNRQSIGLTQPAKTPSFGVEEVRRRARSRLGEYDSVIVEVKAERLGDIAARHSRRGADLRTERLAYRVEDLIHAWRIHRFAELTSASGRRVTGPKRPRG